MNRNERIVSVIRVVHEHGDMGDTIRGQYYRRIISCGFDPGVIGGDIGKVKTSCAIYVRAIKHWAGLLSKRRHKPGEPMVGGWLELLKREEDGWVPGSEVLSGRVKPQPGNVFLVDNAQQTNGHVGFFYAEKDGGWIVAAGGGGDGTRCRIGSTVRHLGPHFDGMGRPLLGIWQLDRAGGWVDECSAPFLPTEDDIPTQPAMVRTLKLAKPRMVGEDVKHWQRVIGATPDGVFGPITHSLTMGWQADQGDLVVDGVVGPKTRARAGL